MTLRRVLPVKFIWSVGGKKRNDTAANLTLSTNHGSITMGSSSDPEHLLRLTLAGATGLAKRELLSFPDPFATVIVDGNTICTTSVLRRTLNPSWNEPFEFTVRASSMITIQVFDHKKFQKKDQGFLGVIILPASEATALANQNAVTTRDLTMSSNNLPVSGKLTFNFALPSFALTNSTHSIAPAVDTIHFQSHSPSSTFPKGASPPTLLHQDVSEVLFPLRSLSTPALISRQSSLPHDDDHAPRGPFDLVSPDISITTTTKGGYHHGGYVNSPTNTDNDGARLKHPVYIPACDIDTHFFSSKPTNGESSETEQANYIKLLQDELGRQERERKEERAREMEWLRQAHAQKEKLSNLESELGKLRILERERKEERETERAHEVKQLKRAQEEIDRLAGMLHRFLPLCFVRPSMTEILSKYLQDTDAQVVVDYLSDILNHSDILQQGERKRALHLLCKIAKSAQVFPKAIELTGVECDLNRSVNEGGFGIIYKGIFQQEPVCIKAVRMYQIGAKKRALRAHAGELVLGTHVVHPNVLPFYGAFISNEPMPRICIASPWMEGGSLVDHLHDYPKTPRIPLVSDILSGLQHLHEMAIVHADLKGRNVLVSGTRRAMLADFGVSRIAMTNAGATTASDLTGTTNWMAPELLTPEEPPPTTRECDIWAFGCVCYEILSGKIPFGEYKPVQLIRAFLSGNAVPPQPDHDPNILYANEIWSLAEKCLRHDPSKRLTADEALKIVTDLNVKDERPPMEADPKMFVKRPRSAVEIDHSTLISIIERVDQNHGT